jgi:CBS domain-containing protein
MDHDLRAQDVMSNPVVAVDQATTLEEVADLLGDREISGLPVVDDVGNLVGVVSERDLAHAIGSPLVRLVVRRPLRTGPFLRTAHAGEGDAQRAADIMTSPPISVHPDTPLHTVAEIMLREEVNRVPIVRDHRLVGIVTRGDVIGAVAGADHSEDREIHPPVIVRSRFAALSGHSRD